MNKFLVRCFYAGLCLLLTMTNAFAQPAFVKASEKGFSIAGQPYRYVGTNYWYGGLLSPVNGEAGRARLRKELDFLKMSGVTNLRVLVGAEGIATSAFRVPYSIQPEEGKIDDKYLRGLDFFLDELGKRNMKAVLFLTNNWDWSGGITEYLKWNGFGVPPTPAGYGSPSTTDGKNWWDEVRKYTAQFYTCGACQTALDNYIKVILTHKNTVNGVDYVNDPAIMAWEIANEPRPMMMDKLPDFQKWLAHTSALIKSIDKNHLLTTGSEGDIAYDNYTDAYSKTHQDANIDYLTIHVWPKNWGWFKDTSIVKGFPDILNNAANYINRHIGVAQNLHKPMVIEEFGLPRDQHKFAQGTSTKARDSFYASMFSYLTDPDKSKGVIAGINFWGMGGYAKTYPEGKIWMPGDDFTCDPGQEEQGLNSVFAGDLSTWRVIRKYSAMVSAAHH